MKTAVSGSGTTHQDKKFILPIAVAKNLTRLLALCIIVGLTAFAAGGPAAKAQTGREAGSQDFAKDETVYGILANDGSITSVEIVNHLFLPGPADSGITTPLFWNDYGRYSRIINLTDGRAFQQTAAESGRLTAAAALSGLNASFYQDFSQISWTSDQADDLYYQGTTDLPLPWEVKISWLLDQKAVEAQEMAGSSGSAGLAISVIPSTQAAATYRKGFTLQVTVPLEMDKARQVEAPGATELVVGKTRTLAYNILPGQTADINISFQAEDFSMQPIQITALPAADVEGFEDLAAGVSQIAAGQSELADGSRQVQSGVDELVSGLSELAGGLSDYTDGGRQISSGLTDYRSGLENLRSSLQQTADGSAELAGGLAELAGQGQPLLTYYLQLQQQLSSLKLAAEQSAQLAELLAMPDTLPDGSSMTAQKEMAASLLTLDGAASQIADALAQLNGGLADYIDATGKISGSFDQLQAGLAQLPGGTDQLITGFDRIRSGFELRESALPSINSGLRQSAEQGTQLPEALGKLAAGQSGLAAALAQIETSVAAMLPDQPADTESFAAPGLVIPASVQFLLRTPGINQPAD